MPDIFYLLSRWWKQVLTIVILALATATIILYLQPAQYLSIATALPASSYSTDRGKIFNNHIQQLYSDIGTTDETDMIIGTGQLDTIYLAVNEEFNLADHYKIKEQGDAAKRKAALLLKKNSKVMKSEYGELKIKVWDTDKMLAPQLANALMRSLQRIHQDIRNESNRTILSALKKTRQQLQTDTTGQSKKEANLQQIQTYNELINEYQLLLDTKAASLFMVEPARAASSTDRPRFLPVLLITGFLSLLFGLLTTVVLERKNKHG